MSRDSSDTCRKNLESNARGTGQWHSLKCLESGTVLFEAKDGPYHPLEEDEVWNG